MGKTIGERKPGRQGREGEGSQVWDWAELGRIS